MSGLSLGCGLFFLREGSGGSRATPFPRKIKRDNVPPPGALSFPENARTLSEIALSDPRPEDLRRIFQERRSFPENSSDCRSF